MPKESILRIGFDDTDSPNAMCTTFLAYKIVNYIKKDVKFLDYPCLIRFNPNIPWKTRGNGAVGLAVKTKDPDKIKESVKKMVKNYSDIKGGANPAVVFYEENKIPGDITKFSNSALCKLIGRPEVRDFISKHKIDSVSLGNGQGLVGAIGAIGYQFGDHTFELLAYRKKSRFGKKRKVDKTSVKKMQEKTFPYTFNSYDLKKNRIFITPHGADPVFFGIRGENPNVLITASEMIKTNEELDGYMTFKTNQGTSDHLKNKIDVNSFKPYTSGFITGTVSANPVMEKGGHVIFSINSNGKDVLCAVYRPTKITSAASQLIKGDKITVGGGVRKASKKHPRVLNVEFIRVVNLQRDTKLTNPFCNKCNKKMKSKGKNQGFECIKCGKKRQNKILQSYPRKIKKELYLPAISAHRHLTRPLQRIGISNKGIRIKNSLNWVSEYNSSGE